MGNSSFGIVIWDAGNHVLVTVYVTYTFFLSCFELIYAFSVKFCVSYELRYLSALSHVILEMHMDSSINI